MDYTFLDDKIISGIYKTRNKDSKKYDFGFLNIVGGSKLYTGSPALCALAALRSGVDLTRIIAPLRAADIAASFSPNLISYPLECDFISKNNVSEILAFLLSAKEASNGKTSLCIGGGLGRNNETKEAVREIISKIDMPMAIDADAIHAVSQDISCLEGKNFVLTPHSHEFYIITGENVKNLNLEKKVEIVAQKASDLKGVIVLKGNPDIISNGKEIFINNVGNPNMTVGGTGDVLAGIIGSLLARGVGLLDAACAGAYITGKAGDIASKAKGEGLTATDVIDAITETLKI